MVKCVAVSRGAGKGEEQMTYPSIWWLWFGFLLIALLLIWVGASNCPMSRRSALWTACGALVPTVVTLAWLYPFPEIPDPLSPLLSGEGGPGGVMTRVRFILVVYGLAGPLYSLRCSSGAGMLHLLTSLVDGVTSFFTWVTGLFSVRNNCGAPVSLQFRWWPTFPVGRDGVVIGSRADCDVRIRGHGVRPRHAQVVLNAKGSFQVQPVEENNTITGVFVRVGDANLRVERDGRVLQAGDTIILGRARLSFVEKPPEAVAPSRAAATG